MDDVVVVPLLSHVWLSATPGTVPHQAYLSFTISWSLLRFTPIELMMPSNHLVLGCPLLLLLSVFPSISVFSSDSALQIRWPKYWSSFFSISPSSGYSGLTSLRIGWFDLFVIQATSESLLQHHSSKTSILWCSVFFMVQLLYLYMTPGKTIALGGIHIFSSCFSLIAIISNCFFL